MTQTFNFQRHISKSDLESLEQTCDDFLAGEAEAYDQLISIAYALMCGSHGKWFEVAYENLGEQLAVKFCLCLDAIAPWAAPTINLMHSARI